MQPQSSPDNAPEETFIPGESDDGESEASGDEELDFDDPELVANLTKLQERMDEIAAIEDDDERLDAAKQLHIELAGGEEAGRA